MKQRTVVVLGGALSGPTAAARAREIEERARIVLLTRKSLPSWKESFSPQRRKEYLLCALVWLPAFIAPFAVLIC